MTHSNGKAAIKVIGGAIREVREQRGLTLEGLAANADISYQYLSGIETGKENFSIRILEKIARALEMPMVALISQAYERQPRDKQRDKERDAASSGT